MNLSQQRALNLVSLHTPAELTSTVLGGCQRLVPASQPVFVQRLPAEGALINKCTFNVRQFLESNPGDMLLGWEVTVWDGVLLDCIGHAVVQSSTGLRCITPSRYGDQTLLFVPDHRLSFDFDDPMARMPSKLIALSSRPEIKRFIVAHEEEHAIRTKYPVSAGNIRVTSEDGMRLQRLAEQQRQLAIRIVLATRDANSACLCGSQKKFRKCCKTMLESMI